MNRIPNINYTTHNGLCTGCGVCKSACPFGAIDIFIKDGCNVPKIDKSKCKNKDGCHRCYDICPGIGVELKKDGEELYSSASYDSLIGKYVRCYTGYSNTYEIRYHSASGGMLSQFLIYLLENSHIDGAVVTRFDKNTKLKVSTDIATTPEEILIARSSKYGPVSFDEIVDKIRNSNLSRIVVVGLPCHIEALRKLEKKDKILKKKIIGHFSLYCSSGRSYYLTEYVGKERGFTPEQLMSFAYRDNGCLGNMVAVYKQDENIKIWEEPFESYYQSLASFFVPTRCKLCMDHYGELADISFGDIHIEPYLKDKIGVNSVVVRDVFWEGLLKDMARCGYATIEEVDVSVVNQSQPMAHVKKERNYIFQKIRNFLGKKSPEYDIEVNAKVTFRYIKWYLLSSLQHFIGFNKWMWWIIPFVKVKVKIRNIYYRK